MHSTPCIIVCWMYTVSHWRDIEASASWVEGIPSALLEFWYHSANSITVTKNKMIKPVIWTYRKQFVSLFHCIVSYHCSRRNDVQHSVRSNSSCLIVIRRGPSDSHFSFPTINSEWVQEGHRALAETLHLIFVAGVFFSMLQQHLVKTENFYFADWWKLGNILLSIIYHLLVLLV